MPISPLPESAVRQLGSTLVLTSPVLLLKELLDNAIDSGATSVDVLVSSNTVDKIEVRDNGHGISPDDFDCLGRPGHTSKLRSFTELSTLGGNTLGFRGSALASVNALAEVSLTTRASTEHVATVILLAKNGGIGRQRHVSAPIGTTVSVTGLFSHLPVRLQVSAKEAPKSLAKMKDLLQAYVLARPWMKLRFTVLKNPNLSWSYAPAPNGGVREPAMQLFGIELASQYTLETYPNEGLQKDDTPSSSQNDPVSLPREQAGVVFEALLPKPGSDPRKLTKGAFISVDARPVSAARGTAKKLVCVFKRQLGDHFSRIRLGTTPKEPFLRLDIRCPPGSYDVNVEPSKEAVLFIDEHHILSLFESFLSSIYSVAAESSGSPQPPTNTIETDVEMHHAVTHGAPSNRSPSHVWGLSGTPVQTAPSIQPAISSWRVDMSSGFDCLSDDEDARNDANHNTGLQQNSRQGPADDTSEPDLAEGNQEDLSKEGLNPWSIAKLISTNRRTSPTPERPAQEAMRKTRPPPLEDDETFGFERSSLLARQGTLSGGGMELQLVRQSQLENPASQGRRLQDVFKRAPRRASARITRTSDRNNSPRRSHGLQSPPTSSPQEYPSDNGTTRKERRFQHAADSDNLIQSQISFDRSNRRRQRRNQVDPDLGRRLAGFSRPEARQTASSSTRRLHSEDVNPVMADPVADEPAPRGGEQASSPHQLLPRRAHDDGGTLAQARQPEGLIDGAAQLGLSTDDPRARLIKQQHLMMQNLQKHRRLKTEQLPLETIPRDSQTCTLLLTMTAGRLSQLLPHASELDSWLVDGRLKSAFETGTGREDPAMLVEPLLARMDMGQLQGRPACQEGAILTGTDGEQAVV